MPGVRVHPAGVRKPTDPSKPERSQPAAAPRCPPERPRGPITPRCYPRDPWRPLYGSAIGIRVAPARSVVPRTACVEGGFGSDCSPRAGGRRWSRRTFKR